ncbi:hypothetical protein HHK36_022355 [Tetracentron sinense]|uniref:Uncharacterized protein n=1 Tax=Tetracentron sinense TaxID=13715 RepID=A0A834YPP1_TETSI|nr:hypothetical protein HHK36_022355 [Tetracentron sinense]
MEEEREGLSSPSAIESEAVWERFRRSDNEDIISRLVSPNDFFSKKDLYHPTLMDEGTLSFALEKSSGKRFSEVLELVNVCRLEIKGKMETRLLSMNTTYAAYLVYKFKERTLGFQLPVKVFICFEELDWDRIRWNIVNLNPEGSLRRRWLQQVYRRKQGERKLVKEREDGWLEIKMGEFFNDKDGREDREVYMDLEGTKEINHKSGLIIQGIELRPKETTIVDSNRDHGESDRTEAEERNKVDFVMPKGCFSNTLSLKTSRYVRRQQTSSSTFRWTLESDAVWERIMPPDYKDILSRSGSPHLIAHSKKYIYNYLCSDLILMDERKMSVALDKWSAKKTYMFGARQLLITWGNDSRYWMWQSLQGSRFSEVAKVSGAWLEFYGKMKTRELSPKTTYVAYVVYKFTKRTEGLVFQPLEVYLRFMGGAGEGSHTAYLDPDGSLRNNHRNTPEEQDRGKDEAEDQQNRKLKRDVKKWMQWERGLPRERGNGWMEIEMGEFFNDQGEDGDVDMGLHGMEGSYWKSGLVIEGIEFRPKEFSEVAQLSGAWLEIHGMMDTGMLSQKTTYAAYFVFKFEESSRRNDHGLSEVYLRFVGGAGEGIRTICLDPDDIMWGAHRNSQEQDVQKWLQGEREFPRVRGDGWKEIEMGEFFNDQGKDGVVDMGLKGDKGLHWKSGLIIQGIELRPKESWLVSSSTPSTVQSDKFWEKLLPPDYENIISTSVSPSSVDLSSKKNLYFHLCFHPILIHGGRTVAQLLRVCHKIYGKMETRILSPKTTYAAYLVFKFAERTGNNDSKPLVVYLKSDEDSDEKSHNVHLDPDRSLRKGHPSEERDVDRWLQREKDHQRERGNGWLEIEMGEFFNDNEDDRKVEMGLKGMEGLNWNSDLIIEGIELRPKEFSEVAVLVDVCWLEIHGYIKTQRLSPKTIYAAYLVFKFTERTHGLDCTVKVSVKVRGIEVLGSSSVCLDPDGILRKELKEDDLLKRKKELPFERKDGWIEIWMGDFPNYQREDWEMDMSLMEVDGRHWKSGLIIQGIELRPTESPLLDSNAFWERFLPPDYQESISSWDCASLVDTLSMKDIYFLLCFQPILIDDGKMSFVLDELSKKKRFMIGARNLSITWGDEPRFSEVAVLVDVCWLEIHGYIKTQRLSPKTIYAAYLVFKFTERTHGLDCTVKVSVKVRGVEVLGSSSVCLDPDGILRKELKEDDLLKRKKELPFERKDGWIEIWMGDFPNYQREDWEMDMSLMEVDGRHWKSGLIIQGIELRPTEFLEVAVLQQVSLLEIHGCITTQILSPNTTYEAYLVFKFAEENYGLDSLPVKLCVKVREDEGAGSALTPAFRFQKEGSRSIYLDPDGSLRKELRNSNLKGEDLLKRKKELPLEREDEWIEIWMGDFDNDQGEDREVVMHLLGEERTSWKSGLVVQGIEVRPKDESK